VATRSSQCATGSNKLLSHSELSRRTAKVDEQPQSEPAWLSHHNGQEVENFLRAGCVKNSTRAGGEIDAEDEANGGGLYCREMTGSHIVELS